MTWKMFEPRLFDIAARVLSVLTELQHKEEQEVGCWEPDSQSLLGTLTG